MSDYYGITGSANEFFSSYFNAGSTSNGSLLSDYASIKNGSYKKLLTAYYEKKDAEKGTSGTAEGEKGTDTSKKAALAATDATALSETAEKLMKRGSGSVFRETDLTKTDEKTGENTTVRGYDRDAITAAVKGFAEKYNALVDSGSDLNNPNILRQTLNLTKMTKANAGILSDVGISIGKDNKLTVDEEKMGKAAMSDLRNIFQGSGSYGSQVASKAGAIAGASSVENAKASGTYSSTGSYSKYLDTGKLYQTLL